MCTCGETQPHVITTKRTADGKPVELWSDGLVTGCRGTYLPGIGRRRLSPAQRSALGAEVCITFAGELAELFATVRRTVREPPKPSGPAPTGLRFLHYQRSLTAMWAVRFKS